MAENIPVKHIYVNHICSPVAGSHTRIPHARPSRRWSGLGSGGLPAYPAPGILVGMANHHFELQTDLSPARWLRDHLVTFAEGVRSLIPEIFDAYARVFHPAFLGEEPVAWREVADSTGTTMHATAQFGNLSGIHQWEYAGPPGPAIWDRAPDEGNLPRQVRVPLVPILRHHTTTPDDCWFGAWVGWGDGRFPDSAPRFTLPAREYFLLRGPVEAIEDSVAGGTGGGTAGLYRRRFHPFRRRHPVTAAPPSAESHHRYQSASLWWPDDRAWFVATEIDLNSTYVGGSDATVAAILASPDLEASSVAPDDPIDFSSDSLNPPPPSPTG